MLGKREAKPDNACPRKNDSDVIERHRHQRRCNFCLLDAKRFGSNFAKQKNENRKNNRERNLTERRQVLYRKGSGKRGAHRVCDGIHHQHRGNVAVNVFFDVHDVARRKLFLFLQLFNGCRRHAVKRRFCHRAERRNGKAT